MIKPYIQLFFGFIFVLASAIGGILIKEAFDNFKKQSTMSQLIDLYALSMLAEIDGLTFPIDPPGILMRHFMSLGIVGMEIFPSEPFSVKYYLTDEGRSFLIKKFKNKNKLYPKIFCDLIMTRYWKGYTSEFSKKKKEFNKKYKISWDKCWEIFIQQIEKEEPRADENFSSYLDKNSFDSIMEKAVNPWLKQIEK